MTQHGLPLLDRLFARVVIAPSGCWLWAGACTDRGYGVMRVAGRTVRVHRLAWELLCGPCPPRLDPDHTCKARNCVNPDHIEWVTHQVNICRTWAGGRRIPWHTRRELARQDAHLAAIAQEMPRQFVTTNEKAS